MKFEAAALRQNPLLINKIIAEKLSDKIQLMMVPTDSKFFFANDVFRSFGAPSPAANQMLRQEPNEPDDAPENNPAH
jgi:hypothetical protein